MDPWRLIYGHHRWRRWEICDGPIPLVRPIVGVMSSIAPGINWWVDFKQLSETVRKAGPKAKAYRKVGVVFGDAAVARVVVGRGARHTPNIAPVVTSLRRFLCESAATLAPCASRDPAFRTGLPTTQMTEKPQSTNAIRVYKQPSPN